MVAMHLSYPPPLKIQVLLKKTEIIVTVVSKIGANSSNRVIVKEGKTENLRLWGKF